MEIITILMGYGPILFSGAVVGAIVSYFGPEIIKALRTNFVHKRVLDLYEGFEKNPTPVEKNQPELAKFFKVFLQQQNKFIVIYFFNIMCV